MIRRIPGRGTIPRVVFILACVLAGVSLAYDSPALGWFALILGLAS